MSEPIERLSRFTPDASGIDRDALLFAAGRASARPGRRWHALCAALATTQLLTLGLAFWPRPAIVQPDPTLPQTPLVEIAPQEPAAPLPAPSLWQQRAVAIASGGELPAPAPVDNPVANEPPLHAFGTLPAALLN